MTRRNDATTVAEQQCGREPDAYDVRCTDGNYEWRRPYHGELEVIMSTGRDRSGEPFEYRALFAGAPASRGATPAEVAGLVERLREGTFGSDITKTDAYLNGLMREAATALEAQAAELAEARADALKVGDQMLAAKFRAERAEASRNGYAKDAAARADECARLRAQLAEANKMLATDDDARRSLKYWIDGTEIIEGCLKKARYAKPEEAPFGMDRAEAQIWHQAQESAYQHALEMMGVPTASGPMIRAAARRALEAQGGE